MFCDPVGSTALSERLDPEDLREVIGAYHRCCANRITEAGLPGHSRGPIAVVRFRCYSIDRRSKFR